MRDGRNKDFGASRPGLWSPQFSLGCATRSETFPLRLAQFHSVRSEEVSFLFYQIPFLIYFIPILQKAQREEVRQGSPDPWDLAQGSFLCTLPSSSQGAGQGQSQWTSRRQLMQRPRLQKTGLSCNRLRGVQPEPTPLPTPVSGPAWWLTLISLGAHPDWADRSLQTPGSCSATTFPRALASGVTHARTHPSSGGGASAGLRGVVSVLPECLLSTPTLSTVQTPGVQGSGTPEP